eukprot:TRINITY_DN542_c0_g1_i3.p1 TRINITY_DN542_c0_g1~~TRINITY_DN542_c0_g1_i3.p1  ORF type:complete len:576 (-),score=154.83 TRINITY_DN542_c0_g1_i3:159-1886(-)
MGDLRSHILRSLQYRYLTWVPLISPRHLDLENAEAVVLCLATYGEGEPTDSTIDFYEQLNDEFHADDMLSKVKFTVFGLGNKTYKHYNSMGKWADKRFAELGATRIYDMGLGDDDACLEDDFIEWERELFPTLCKEFNIDTSDIGNPEDMPYEFVYSIQFLEPTDPKIPKRNRFVYGNKRTYTATISENQELHTSKSDRSCLHIDFDIAESCVSYEAGDHMAIYPANDKDLVDAMLKRVGASADQYFKLTAKPDSDKKHHYPCPITVGTALSMYADLTTPPTTTMLKALSEFAEDDTEKERLKYLSSSDTQARAEYQSYVKKSHRILLEILNEFPSVKIPLEGLLEILPPLHPRYYSIASSPKMHVDNVHATVAVVRYTSPTGRAAKGVATTYLADLKPGSKVNFSIRRSTFHLPAKPTVPVIMVGPGTGLAPFRGFLQERASFIRNGADKGEPGKRYNRLYFGCRRRDEDYIYEKELQQYVEEGVCDLRVAFSREQKDKVYVQHLLAEDGPVLYDLLKNKKAYFYVCGDGAQMAKDVDKVLKQVVQKEGKLTTEQADQFVEDMVEKGRYMQDVW